MAARRAKRSPGVGVGEEKVLLGVLDHQGAISFPPCLQISGGGHTGGLTPAHTAGSNMCSLESDGDIFFLLNIESI